MKKVRKKAKQEVSQSANAEPVLDGLLSAMGENAAGIVGIWEAGGFPVVVYEPSREVVAYYKRQGVKVDPSGVTVVGANRARFIEGFCKCDHVTENWATRERGEYEMPIFVFIHSGTFLLNVSEKGYSLEPGSLDGDEREWALS